MGKFRIRLGIIVDGAFFACVYSENSIETAPTNKACTETDDAESYKNQTQGVVKIITTDGKQGDTNYYSYNSVDFSNVFFHFFIL